MLIVFQPYEGCMGFAGLVEEDVEDVTYLWHRGLGVHSQRADKLTEPILFKIATLHDVQQQQHQQQVNSYLSVNSSFWQVAYNHSSDVHLPSVQHMH